jgi:hypothetical protein
MPRIRFFRYPGQNDGGLDRDVFAAKNVRVHKHAFTERMMSRPNSVLDDSKLSLTGI